MRLADANINPATGLATDYLNHFNEAIMLLEMVSTCPDCLTDFLDWQPKSYREHFLDSRFKDRQLAVAAYDAADPTMRELSRRARRHHDCGARGNAGAMDAALPQTSRSISPEKTVAWLKPLSPAPAR